ncbi:hypothetical protein [Microbulbifer hydrolyticus]|uniref:Lipoprotein n=1 Tax=Microbulbifer hydrolyticus TaxID=48074 RepID=A0A6P1T6W0_9GAMM|nr:hypothetical protein [Microbulbifer hydrolyticus]MBB5211731.1 hypothetical protein [Microbulbifer hydrolyticus]QHQ37541.1 hypothetical protein GTQ55_00160 [Microbulbifer hydrolyticus]
MQKIIAAILCLSLASCASIRPENATNYESQLQYPDETGNFVMINKKVFDEPMLGILLEYTNKQYTRDNIDVYVYPIASFDWSDAEETLNGEMQRVLAEIDQAIEYGHYQNRGPEVTEPYAFSQGGKQFSGLKSSFELTDKNGIKYYSNAYVFLDKDKYLKFRTSFNSIDTVPWNGDEAVNELLPAIEVPGESEYMAGLRAEHKKRFTQHIMKLLLQAAQENPEE